MWQVENATPFPAIGDWVRDREGAEVWIVAIRAAFLIRPDGRTEVARDQDPPAIGPLHRGDPVQTSMLHDSDFYLSKPTTDILLHGQAHAPQGRAAPQVDVGMRVGPVTKILRVTGDRMFQDNLGLTPGAPEPFLTMPITYERARGGREVARPADPAAPRFDPRNPIGCGFEPLPGLPVPNIDYPPGTAGARGPAGFGPIPPHWQPRMRHAGTYDEAWQKDRMPLYPRDLDERFFLCSPEDQRPPSHLRGGEAVMLGNLTPAGRLSFLLPRLAFRLETEFRGRPTRIHRVTLHTVILEPDVPRVVMVWHSALPAHADVHRLQTTYISPLRVLGAPPESVPAGLVDPDEVEREA